MVVTRDPPLRLSDRFSHMVRSGDATILVADEDAVLIDHPQAASVVRLLDGSRTAPEIAEALADSTRPEITHFALICLERAGIVEPCRGEGIPTSREPPPPQSSDVAALRAAWEGRGSAAFASALVDCLPGVTVLLAQDYLADGLRDAVRAEITNDVLLVRLGRKSAWVGPLLQPAGAPCIACLQERLRLNLTGHALVHGRGKVGHVHVAPIESPLRPEIFEWAAVGLVEKRTAAGTGASNSMIDVRGEKGISSRHVVSSLEHCGECGNPNVAVPGASITLRPLPISADTLGGYRTRSPSDTFDRYADLVSPLTGVVRSLRRVETDSMDSPLVHVYTASHALEYAAVSVDAMRDGRRDPSGGKGRTDIEARVSALCESLERFSSVHRGTEQVRRASLSDLGAQALHPNEIMLFSERQFRDREGWNRQQAGDFQLVPIPYEDQVIEWCELRSLGTDSVVLAPASLVYFGFRGEGASFAKGDSNGLAGGNCLEEAILQAFFELVERDAIAIWWYNRLRRPGIDLASFEDSYLDRVTDLYDSLGRSLWALDLTTDLGIPCVAAVSHLRDGEYQDVIFGFGAHLDVGIALSRAVTELNQMLPTIQRSRDQRRRQLLPEFRDAIDWWDRARVESETYLTPAERTASRDRAYFRTAPYRDLRECVVECVDRARGVGSDVLVYDLTRADVGLPVVRVIAPGLRHFWRRLAPGRLYEVPVRVGWLGGPLDEEQMNPISMFV